jgi:two-component system invasion response regulator UvrY
MESIIRIAIAEDQEIVRRGVIEILHSFGGYRVDIEADNGRELIDKIAAAETLPDLAIIDVSMPVMDGYETMDILKKKWPDLNVLVLTMHKHEFAIIKMFRSGANGYLLKNSSPKTLQTAIQSILETGLYFSEIASGKLYYRLQHSNIIPSLTEKEIQLLKLCPTDFTYKEIADMMKISERSVAGYRTTLFEKLEVNSRAGLVVCGIQMGLIPS